VARKAVLRIVHLPPLDADTLATVHRSALPHTSCQGLIYWALHLSTTCRHCVMYRGICAKHACTSMSVQASVYKHARTVCACLPRADLCRTTSLVHPATRLNATCGYWVRVMWSCGKCLYITEGPRRGGGISQAVVRFPISVVHIRCQSEMAPLITVLKWRLRHIIVINGEIHTDGRKS